MRKVLKTAAQTMANLADSAPHDKDLQRSHAAMFINFGDVYAKTGSPGALTIYEKALAISRKLAVDPGDTKGQRDVSVSLNRIGDSKLRSGDAAGASTPIKRGSPSPATLPQPIQARRSRSATSGQAQQIGDLKFRSGDAEGALKTYEEGLAIARKLPRQILAMRSGCATVSISLDLIGESSFEAATP